MIPAASFGTGLIVGSASSDSGTENGSQAEQTVAVTDRGEDSGGGRVNRRGRHAYHRGQAQATQPSAPIFTGGVWAVPSEVKPGVYATAGAELCYWARLRDAGDPNSIIVNSFGQAGRQRMTIRSSDGGFQSRDFGEWRKVG